mmetsp:Transcript_97354/g.225702  ORF Transcript_97354/g.225702 Transcript_97354/m.225702 type:complete len:643 (+) Transcript_97354:64-1992(+)|eukprot:CAMPEP_0171062638 /NCGR_PEP_ID=MMETSP0766_2-20121228/5158_1 /TAXON_ID=439317 /ORGANISM="Gambierdiscus australes, Strain CAWD 149" /LENGTH=642 /DNA_ID=CAMNT_0011518439 /DNA_START=24 /DNA_END=1952 /DNA_ORIENTATION=-
MAVADSSAEPSVLFRSSLLQLLEVGQLEAERWLQEHHRALRDALERVPGPVEAEQWLLEHDRALREAVERKLQEPVEEINTIFDPVTKQAVEPPPSQPLASQPLSAPQARISSKCFGSEVTMSSRSARSQLGSPMASPRDIFAQPSSNKSSFVRTLMENHSFDDTQTTLCEHVFKDARSTALEMGIGALIILNTIAVFVQLELNGSLGDEALGLGPSPNLNGVNLAFLVLAHVFNAVFLLELAVKFYVYGSSFLKSSFDVFDMLIVLANSVDLYLISPVKWSFNISFLRATRMLRLARLLRAFRVVNVFQQLRVLLQTVFISFLSIFWSMLILLLFMLVSALMLCQLLQDYVQDESGDLAMRYWAHRYYGTSSKALYTIYEATFSGCWPAYARDLVENVSPWYAAFFVVYVTFIIFTLIRIIYALLLKDTLQAAASDADLVVRVKMKETKHLIQQLSALFQQADTSGDGFLGREEFEQILGYPKVKTWMNTLGLDTHDTEELFAVLDDGENPDGMISREEFVHGIMHMKGQAHKQNVLSSARDMHRIMKHCKALHHEILLLKQPLLRRGSADDAFTDFGERAAKGSAGTIEDADVGPDLVEGVEELEEDGDPADLDDKGVNRSAKEDPKVQTTDDMDEYLRV